MSELPQEPPAAGARAAVCAVVRGLGCGALLGFVVLAIALQRARFVGLSAPLLQDWLPALLAGVLGVLIGRRAHRSARGAQALSLGVATVAAAIAAAVLWQRAEPGSLWIQLPQCLVLGAALARLGTVAAPRRLDCVAGAVAAIAGGALAPLAFAAALARVGPSATASLGVAATLAAALLAPRAPSPHSAGGRAWGAVGIAAALLLCVAVPQGSWSQVEPVPRLAFGGLAAGALAAWLGGARWLTLACALLAVLFAPWSGPCLPHPTERLVVLAHRGAAAAAYERATQELQLWCDATLVDAAGPDRPQAELTATLLATLLGPGDRVLLLGLGTGRLPRALDRAGVHLVDAVDFRAGTRTLLGRLAGDGPVPAPSSSERGAIEPLPCRVVERGLAGALKALPPHARQAIVVAEPLHGRSGAQTTVELQRELRRVAGAGLVVQPFAMDRTPTTALGSLFAAAAAAHPWNGVFAVGECALLLSAAAPPVWPAPGTLEAWSDAARWQAHSAHVGSVADLQRAWLGTVAPAAAALAEDEQAPCVEPPQERSAVLAVLHDLLVVPAEAVPPDPGSLLQWWTQSQALLRSACRTLQTMPGDAEAAARAAALATPFLPIGAPRAALQAALALPDGQDVRLRNPAAASLCAQAIDPTFFLAAPPLFAALPRPRRPTGELEDRAALPKGERLAELCAGELPLAVALRARFPSACAQALVEALAEAPLPSPRAQALRELADPFVLREAGRVLGARAAVRELLGLWRGDLAMPDALAALQNGSAEERRTLVEALAGRRDGASLKALGAFLVDPDRALRSIAGTSLFATVGNRVEYDPDWPQPRLAAAAEQLRALHHRAP